MLDARSVYRKVTRKIFDFSPEQLESYLYRLALSRADRAICGACQTHLDNACSKRTRP